MLFKTEGTFFNGESSKPFLVSAGLSDDLNALVFSSDEIPVTTWSIHDVVPDLVGGRITIRHKEHKEQLLNISDPAFSETFLHYYHRRGNAGIYQKIVNVGSVFHITLAISVVVLICLAYFYFVPFIAEKAVDILPVSYDESLGITVYENYVESEVVDNAKTKALRKFAGEINFGSDRKLNFTVIKSSEINAFALPDGNIIVYTGILEKINSYPQLAALLAHEAAHVTYRHSMRSLCRSVSGYLIISVVTTDMNGIMAVLADNANNLNNLSYSRKFESEADEKGYEVLVNNKINPNGIVELFEILKESEKTSMPEFLSTHPLTDERINNAIKSIREDEFYFDANDELENDFNAVKGK